MNGIALIEGASTSSNEKSKVHEDNLPHQDAAGNLCICIYGERDSP